MSYNGWLNWETWLMALYINNDEGTQDEARAVCLQDIPEYEAVQNLREWAEETLLNVEDEGIIADIVGGFAADVFWLEIVRNIREGTR